MKILVLTSLFPPYLFGGAEIAAYNMVKLLVSKGHDVHVATVQEKDSDAMWATEMPEGYKMYRLKIPRSHTLYERNVQQTKLSKLVWHIQDYVDSRNSLEVQRLLDTVKPEHIDIHNITGIGYNTLPVLNNCDASVAYVVHDLGLACFHTSMFKNGENCNKQCGGCRVSSFSRQQYLKKVDRFGIVSPSKANLKKLIDFVPFLASKPQLVLHNVLDDLPPLPEYTNTGVVKLLYVGRIDSLKGINFLLEVLSGLANEFSFHLTILGKGPEEEQLRVKYKDAQWVSFLGFVTSSEVAKHLAISDFYCIPSIWAETYGMTTAQALRIGTPVIGSNIGGTTELVKNGLSGILIEPGNLSAWSEELRSLFNNPSIAQKLRHNAKKFSDEFDLDQIAMKYESFVSSLNYKDF